MNRLTRTVTLISDHHYGRRPPPQAVGAVLSALPEVVRQAVSMAVLGHSDDKYGSQSWLEAAADLRFTDHQGDDESVLVFSLGPRRPPTESVCLFGGVDGCFCWSIIVTFTIIRRVAAVGSLGKRHAPGIAPSFAQEGPDRARGSGGLFGRAAA